MDFTVLMPNILIKFDWVTPNKSAKCRRWGKIKSAIFEKYLAISQK